MVYPLYSTNIPHNALGSHFFDLKIYFSLYIKIYTVKPKTQRWLILRIFWY